MAWKSGPLPLGTRNYGGVVLVGDDASSGFYFADFRGNHVLLPGMQADGTDRRVEAAEIALYDNSLELPPGVRGRDPVEKGAT